MPTSNPRNIALIDALLITLISTSVFIVIELIFHSFIFQSLFIFIPVIYLTTYGIIKYSIDKFIFEKIKIIYKTIGKLKTKHDTGPKKKVKDDVLDIVNQAVLEWSKEQKKEIAELKRTAAYRREFIGNVSHELKTPIFNIQGYVLTLLDGGLQDDEVNIKFLKRTKKSVNRLISIVEDLEEISKFESGELKLAKETFDLNELIRDVIEYMEMKAAENNVSIRLDTSAFPTYSVLADKKRVRQVLINLIDNAIKYSDKEKGEVSISIFDFHNYYLTEVTDNGTGIPEEFLFRVFERFFRTDRPVKTKRWFRAWVGYCKTHHRSTQPKNLGKKQSRFRQYIFLYCSKSQVLSYFVRVVKYSIKLIKAWRARLSGNSLSKLSDLFLYSSILSFAYSMPPDSATRSINHPTFFSSVL